VDVADDLSDRCFDRDARLKAIAASAAVAAEPIAAFKFAHESDHLLQSHTSAMKH